jgi:hypothetical protein
MRHLLALQQIRQFLQIHQAIPQAAVQIRMRRKYVKLRAVVPTIAIICHLVSLNQALWELRARWTQRKDVVSEQMDVDTIVPLQFVLLHLEQTVSVSLLLAKVLSQVRVAQRTVEPIVTGNALRMPSEESAPALQMLHRGRQLLCFHLNAAANLRDPALSPLSNQMSINVKLAPH